MFNHRMKEAQYIIQDVVEITLVKLEKKRQNSTVMHA